MLRMLPPPARRISGTAKRLIRTHVAKIMACTAVDVLQDDVLLARAKADHQARVGRTPYVCPLPDELDPPLKMSA